MKIAITGGAGFIGTELARLLKEQGHELVLLDLVKSGEFPECSHIVDVTDADTVKRALKGVDVIYNLAAEHRDDVQPVQKYYDVNRSGAKNIAEAARAHNIKTIIFTSTVAVYGLNAGESRETDRAIPFNDYGKSKLRAEDIFTDWVRENNARSLTTLRLVATFGPGNRGNIYTLMDQINRGKFLMVGGGRNRKSIAYVRNVAAFLAHCMDLGPGSHLYNYADKPDLTTKELVRNIRFALGLTGPGLHLPYVIGLAGGMTFDIAAKLTGKTFPVSTIRVRKFCANTIVNADKIKETGFTAPYALEDGLREMIVQEFPQQNDRAA